MTRRGFLGASMAGVAAAAPERLPIKKAVYIGMIRGAQTYADRFKIAQDAGFDAIECATAPAQSTADEIKKASQDTGLRIHSVMNQAHWKLPLSSADPAVVAESLKGMETSLKNAQFWGAETVLLVPAVVNPQTGYRDAWVRSQQNIRTLIPLAQQLKVIIGIEDVWNKFLLSPLEMANYVDEFKSPWIKAYFDVGNIVFYGYPQDWIRTLGKRIVRLHFKDFRVQKGGFEFVNLREGQIDWPAVHQALGEVGYNGVATCELNSGDAAYLKDVCSRMEQILSGQ